MRAALTRLLLLLSLLAVISAFQMMRVDRGTPVTLAAGALLLCGLFAGKVIRGIGLPRLTGYLLIGILIGPYALKFIPHDGVAGLELVKGLAVSLIALTAGTELRLGLIRRVGAKVLYLCTVVSICVFLASALALIALRPLLPFLAQVTWPQAIAISLLVSTVIVSFSPTVTIAIIQESRAQGTFTEFLMAMVIVGDLVVMIAFAVTAAITRASFGGEVDLPGLAGGVGWELFGSLLVGGAMGFLTLFYLRRLGKEVPIFICAMCFVSAEMGTHLGLSSLLLSLSAGMLISNLDENLGSSLNHGIERASLPVFALFFAAAGAGLHLDVLRTVGPVALVLVAIRAGVIYLSTRKFAPKDDLRLGRYLWMGLVSQAGVTFGLAALVRRTFPSFGIQVEVLIVAMVTMHELIGPVLTRRALQQSGEVYSDAEPQKA